MNTGTTIETKRLLLIPGNNARDDVPFTHMLRKDGSFREFCGLEFREKYLDEFRNYFERTGHEECVYSIFRKDEPDNKFIGYVGFHREHNSRYELEFYISQLERKKGYCEEACKAVIELIFSEGISVDGNVLRVQKLYATTLTENLPAIHLLSKLGFERDRSKDGSAFVMEGFEDKESGEFLFWTVFKYVLENGGADT